MIWIFYYLVSYGFVGLIRISSLWSVKSRLGLTGRRGWRKTISTIPYGTGPRVWFHVSSLGEFEQARPVVETLKKIRPETEIILSFFSASGYTIRSGYTQAHVVYLPFDLPGVAKEFIAILKPDIAVFVKYDLWPGYLKALQERDIPGILISANWIPNQTFSSWNLPPTRSLLKKFHKIFLQRDGALSTLAKMGFHNLDVAGDTRIDRCLELPKEAHTRIPDILKSYSSFDMVAGSTWPQDEQLLFTLASEKNLKMIIAPHDISGSNIERLMRSLPVKAVRLSQLNTDEDQAQIIIIDNIGLLAVLYSLGKIAYIGGGFGSGIHNILEPMAHGCPVIFGPRYQKFPEAIEMVEAGGAIAIRNQKELHDAFDHLSVPENHNIASNAITGFLEKNKGASQKVTNYLTDIIPFRDQS